MRSISLPLAAAKNKLHTEQAVLFLFEIALLDSPATVLHAAANDQDVIFAGQRYQAYEITMDAVASDSEAGTAETRLYATNVPRDLTFYLEQGGLVGQQITLRVVHEAHLDSGDELLVAYYTVRQAVVTDVGVELTLGLPDMVSMRVPGPRYDEQRCQFVYKGTRCAYAGALGTCTKLLEGDGGCRDHDNVARFGGFPGQPRDRQ
jgi:phage-related protein